MTIDTLCMQPVMVRAASSTGGFFHVITKGSKRETGGCNEVEHRVSHKHIIFL